MWYWRWGAAQLGVLAMGLTQVDHFQPGWRVARPKVTPPIEMISTRPLSKVRFSSGWVSFFFCMVLMVVFLSPRGGGGWWLVVVVMAL